MNIFFATHPKCLIAIYFLLIVATFFSFIRISFSFVSSLNLIFYNYSKCPYLLRKNKTKNQTKYQKATKLTRNKLAFHWEWIVAHDPDFLSYLQ